MAEELSDAVKEARRMEKRLRTAGLWDEFCAERLRRARENGHQIITETGPTWKAGFRQRVFQYESTALLNQAPTDDAPIIPAGTPDLATEPMTSGVFDDIMWVYRTIGLTEIEMLKVKCPSSGARFTRKLAKEFPKWFFEKVYLRAAALRKDEVERRAKFADDGSELTDMIGQVEQAAIAAKKESDDE